MYMGNLDENISEEDLHGLFGLKSTKYIQETCKVGVIKNKRSGISRKLAYVTGPDHVSKKLLKLNTETLKERPSTIEEAKKLPNSPMQSPTKIHPSIVINHHSENQTTFDQSSNSSREQTYRNAAIQKTKFPAKTLILSDSIARGIRIYELSKYINMIEQIY